MDQLQSIVEHFEKIIDLSDSLDEYWNRITIKGSSFPNQLELFIKLFSYTRSLGAKDPIILDSVSTGLDYEALQERLSEHDPLEEWTLVFNKETLMDHLFPPQDVKSILFLSLDKFKTWSEQLSSNPFKITETENPLRKFPAVKFFVQNLQHPFGGPRIAFCGIDGKITYEKPWPFQLMTPGEEKIKAQVHVIPSCPTVIDPSIYLISWGDLSCDEAIPYCRASGVTLAACLTRVFYSIDHVEVHGVKHLDLQLISPEDPVPNKKSLELLLEAVAWAYEERVDTRLKLLSDRLTIDISDANSLLKGLCDHLSDAFRQSQEQYKFVILDRKDEYAKERRELLKDVKGQADLYAKKIRNLVNSLFRDVLAALLLSSVTILTRFLKENDFNSIGADFLFKILSVYYIFSIFLQVLISCRDISLSKNELKYWSNETRQYMSIEEFNILIKNSLSERSAHFYKMLALLIVIYIILILTSWNVMSILTFFGVFKG